MILFMLFCAYWWWRPWRRWRWARRGTRWWIWRRIWRVRRRIRTWARIWARIGIGIRVRRQRQILSFFFNRLSHVIVKILVKVIELLHGSAILWRAVDVDFWKGKILEHQRRVLCRFYWKHFHLRHKQSNRWKQHLSSRLLLLWWLLWVHAW